MLKRWRESKQVRRQAVELYAHAVAAARQASLYDRYDIPDTLDGRFDAVMLHVFLVLDAVAAHGPETLALQRALQEVMVDDLDRSVREAGVGDFSVGKKVHTMASACRGRLMAYSEAVAEGDRNALTAALARNIYRSDSHPAAPRLADYVQERRTRMSRLSLSQLVEDGGLPTLEQAPVA
ncbi:MAG: ubiquinol-cytochrome C chaperone family protein [Rhodothalassiaceae bacterium]